MQNNNSIMDEFTPTQFFLSQNYPNPFREKTLIKYCVPLKTKVHIAIYNAHGEMLKVLVDEIKNPGTYETEINVINQSAIAEPQLADGYYYYLMKAEEFSSEKKWFCINHLFGRLNMKTLIQTLFFFFLTTQICIGQWYQQNSGTTQNLHAVQFINSNTGWAVGDSGTIIKTTNSGATWFHQTSGTYHTLFDLQFININMGWAVGAEGFWNSDSALILKTTDGGANWIQQLLDTSLFLNILNSVFFINENNGWIGAADDSWSNVVLKTTNGGTNWQPKIVQSEYVVIDDIYFTNTDIGFAVTYGLCSQGTTGQIFKTTDGGETWFELTNPFSGYHCISFLNEQIGIITGFEGNNKYDIGFFLTTTDGGTSWNVVMAQVGFLPNCVDFIDMSHAWAVGYYPYDTLWWGGSIYFSSNMGMDWTCQGVFSNVLNCVYFTDATSGWAVGDSGIIIHTTNGGVPVELTSFTATSKGEEVILNWTTSTETNNAGFEILRFTQNDNEWNLIGYVPGFGTTTEPKSYSYTDSKLSSGKYTYQLKQIDFDGSYEYSPEVELVVSAPLTFSLEQNYPNPFNPTTTIGFGIPEKSSVSLSIINILGEEIRVLLNEEKEAGYHSIDFNASDLPSGVYFYKLKVNEYVNTKKMILIK